MTSQLFILMHSVQIKPPMTFNLKLIILLNMSLLSILFGCNTKKKSTSVPEWPRFPATDKSEILVTAVPLADNFNVMSFYISPDKQNTYVFGSRVPQEG